MAAMALMTVQSSGGRPTLAAAAAQFGVAPEDIDPKFGVILVDSRNGLYAVQVRADRLPPGTDTAKGPFSNPKISIFGAAESSSDSSEISPPSEARGEPEK